MKKAIYMVDHSDNGPIGYYSTPKKAVAAVVEVLTERKLTANASKIKTAIKELKTEGWHDMIAVEAENEYDEDKTYMLRREWLY